MRLETFLCSSTTILDWTQRVKDVNLQVAEQDVLNNTELHKLVFIL